MHMTEGSHQDVRPNGKSDTLINLKVNNAYISQVEQTWTDFRLKTIP
jgi:hypothetical protein